MEVTQELVLKCNSFAELTRKLGRSPHNRINKQLRKKLIELKISFEHFTKNGIIKNDKIKKICPICQNEFELKNKVQITCSHSCSNTYFAKKRNKPEKYKSYKTICFYHFPKKCIVCDEEKIVEVHHMDENHKNNNPKNLIPLCPTHHQYWHSRYRDLIREKVLQFINNQQLMGD